MSVMVKLQLEIKDLELLISQLREAFPRLEVLPGVEDRMARSAALERALKGEGLAVHQYRQVFRNGVARVPRSTPGVSRYGDIGVLAEGTPDRPVYRLVYDAHGTDLRKVQAVVQGYVEALVRRQAARQGYRVERRQLQDGSLQLVLRKGGGR